MKNTIAPHNCNFTTKLKAKLNLDLKNREIKHTTIEHYFDVEGKIIGQQDKTKIANLLERASNKIETLIGKNILHSTLFGSLSFSQI